MLTGSVSNVATHHYGGPPDRPDSPQDLARDATTLPLIQAALSAGLPLFCICRGLQELNVALGGTLHTEVHRQPGRLDHRSLQGVPYEEKYGPRHPVLVTPGGRLAALVGPGPIAVNSLHWQAIDRPAERLVVEGRAPDGTIEAVSVRDAAGFALGVQWHPEFKPLENPSRTRCRAGSSPRSAMPPGPGRRAGPAGRGPPERSLPPGADAICVNSM